MGHVTQSSAVPITEHLVHLAGALGFFVLALLAVALFEHLATLRRTDPRGLRALLVPGVLAAGPAAALSRLRAGLGGRRRLPRR